MTLFGVRPNRVSEISNPYVMALAFVLGFTVTKITLKVIKQVQIKNNPSSKGSTVYNPHGGNWSLEGIETQELSSIILSCIANEENCLVKSEKIRRWIFTLVKRNLNAQSLILSPNLFRFLALNLLKTDESLIAQISRTLQIINKKLRFGLGVSGLAVIHFVSAGYPPHPDYYKLPIEPIGIVEQSRRNLIVRITHQVDPSETPSLEELEESETKTEVSTSEIERKKSGKYRKEHRKSQSVRFDEFRKKDPILKYWNSEKVYLDEYKFGFRIDYDYN